MNFKLSILSVVGFVYFACSTAALADSKKMVVLGDSLSEGYGVAQQAAYPALLEAKIKATGKNWQVINSGVSGSTTASAVSRIKWLLASKPDLVFLALGANDGLRGLKVEESRKNLDEAIKLLKNQKVVVVLGGLYMPPNYGKEYTESFKKIFSSLAKENQIRLVPFILNKVAGDSKYNLADGIHPNEKGHQMIAETIFKAIQDLL